MKKFAFWKLILLCGALAVFGCKSNGGDAEGSGAAAAEGGDEAAEGGDEAAEGGDEAAEGGDEAAAGPIGDDALVGSWSLDVDKTLESEEMTEEERAMARAFIGAMNMTFTFNADNTMNMSATLGAEPQTRTGTYEVTARDGNTWTVSGTVEGSGEGAEPETNTLTITFVDANTMSLADGGQTMVFSRDAQ